MTAARAYYNDNDRGAAHVIRCLIADGVIAPGDVDDRSIKDVQPNDLAGYTQCHFFAGGGLWSVAARLAGWPDDRPLWTGSCPCQPFSTAGRGLGTSDPRHLWPDFFRLIRTVRPPVIMGEQVAGSAGYGWFDGVGSYLEDQGYACRAVDIPACAVDAPHIRSRLYWLAVGDAVGTGLQERERPAVFGARGGQEGRAAGQPDRAPRARDGSWWAGAEWLHCADGKARRAQPGIRLLVDGLPGRVGLWRVAGNAISPILAAEVIAAFMETCP